MASTIYVCQCSWLGGKGGRSSPVRTDPRGHPKTKTRCMNISGSVARHGVLKCPPLDPSGVGPDCPAARVSTGFVPPSKLNLLHLLQQTKTKTNQHRTEQNKVSHHHLQIIHKTKNTTPSPITLITLLQWPFRWLPNPTDYLARSV
ncbi:hypothetical protein PGT21_021519 [Puccinia graminis f. sp. tritici]|uniref:Uncharacterized protein n=1 Tax=Puccinia graminis f. sp. tritici TaxID=56615 RepID=A0A5B0QTM7_PUCGR|nr:hypothetical protein PGT21_021519 [Puccinia graminis f. sp. tritici]